MAKKTSPALNALLSGKSTEAAGNTLGQEKFISGLQTEGALDENSGFQRAFGKGETESQYAKRLEAWKGKKGGATGGQPSQGGALTALQAGPAAAPEGAGLGAAEGMDMGAATGMPINLPMMGALKQGLGNRIYPELYSALAGLKRIY